MKFEDLLLSPPLLRAVAAEGYETPTPIQEQAIPHILAGSDLLGCAQTGTGKTAAFALPVLQLLSAGERPATKHRRPTRALVLSPTRELASQIAESFQTYGRHCGLRHAVIYGGVSQHAQVKALKAGVDIVIATPGRLLDLMNQGYVDLSSVEIFVLDEADRMLDMGFIHDIRRICTKVPQKRQTLFFSATMPRDIQQLADSLLRNPVKVQIAAASSTVDLIEQAVYFVDSRNKPVLLQHLLTTGGLGRTLVFTRTKRGADKVVHHLEKSGIRAEAIHGNKTQAARQRALVKFCSKQPPVLVATDVAARGLDIDDISHVINFDLPNVPETYIHRIGRTGRAGASGIAISFCGGEERSDLKAVERLIRKTVRVLTDHPEYPRPAPGSSPQPSGRSNNQRPQGQGRGGSSPAGEGKRHFGNKKKFPSGNRTARRRSELKPALN